MKLARAAFLITTSYNDSGFFEYDGGMGTGQCRHTKARSDHALQHDYDGHL